MISFDRKTGNVNLTPVWDEINSIKSDTSSLYTMITAGGGVIPEELLNSISLLTSNTEILSSEITSLNNNTLYFNNELYSLKTDTSTIASDTAGLNMDVVSLYNICSSLSDSISTITGGGGGGFPYYLAYSDAIASSLNFAYNMTGDIPSLAYDNIMFCGSMGTLSNYTIPSSFNKFTLSGLDLISNVYFVKNTVEGVAAFVSLDVKTMTSNTFCSFGMLDVRANSFLSNSISRITKFKCGCLGVNSNTFYYNTGIISGNSLIGNFVYSNVAIIDFPYMVRNTFRYCWSINAVSFDNNAYAYNKIGVLNIASFYGNTFDTMGITPNINADLFLANRVGVMNDITINANDSAANNTFSAFFDPDETYQPVSTSDVNLKINVQSYSANHVWSINEVKINCAYLMGDNGFVNVNTIDFNKIQHYLDTFRRPGRTYSMTFSNSFSNIKLIKATNSINDVKCCCGNIIGVQTMQLNYNWSWGFPTDVELHNIQPTNIYTLDFYKCDNYIGGSIFTIPSFYSGYDEGNVWISGKPLSELGYSLSISS